MLFPEPPLHPPQTHGQSGASGSGAVQMCTWAPRCPPLTLAASVSTLESDSPPRSQGQSQVSFAGSRRDFSLRGGWTGPLSYAWHVRGHGTVTELLGAGYFGFAFCLLLFLNTA